jgi:hypothetical protein
MLERKGSVTANRDFLLFEPRRHIPRRSLPHFGATVFGFVRVVPDPDNQGDRSGDNEAQQQVSDQDAVGNGEYLRATLLQDGAGDTDLQRTMSPCNHAGIHDRRLS